MNQLIPLSEGFILGLGLIVGLGPQNSFILQQGLRRKHVLTIALLASLIDGCLIALGVGGVNSFFADRPVWLQLLTWSGVAFLLIYGWKSFVQALSPVAIRATKTNGELGCSAVILAVLAVSLLNPSAYLDTFFIIGSKAAHYTSSLKPFFALGAALASILWFFALAFGAAKFSRVLSSTRVLRLVDVLGGVIMWFIAIRLLLQSSTFFA